MSTQIESCTTILTVLAPHILTVFNRCNCMYVCTYIHTVLYCTIFASIPNCTSNHHTVLYRIVFQHRPSFRAPHTLVFTKRPPRALRIFNRSQPHILTALNRNNRKLVTASVLHYIREYTQPCQQQQI